MAWEFSSHLVLWSLIPLVAWWLGRFPFSRPRWPVSLPAHLVATAPFSLLHTAGMVLLRQGAYRVAGAHYDFGPFWANWAYEYRKDFVTYCALVGALSAFRVYGLWLDSRANPRGDGAATTPEHPQETLRSDGRPRPDGRSQSDPLPQSDPRSSSPGITGTIASCSRTAAF